MKWLYLAGQFTRSPGSCFLLFLNIWSLNLKPPWQEIQRREKNPHCSVWVKLSPAKEQVIWGLIVDREFMSLHADIILVGFCQIFVAQTRVNLLSQPSRKQPIVRLDHVSDCKEAGIITTMWLCLVGSQTQRLDTFVHHFSWRHNLYKGKVDILLICFVVCLLLNDWNVFEGLCLIWMSIYRVLYVTVVLEN